MMVSLVIFSVIINGLLVGATFSKIEVNFKVLKRG
jgi:hypothetical protein